VIAVKRNRVVFTRILLPRDPKLHLSPIRRHTIITDYLQSPRGNDFIHSERTQFNVNIIIIKIII